MIGADGRKLSTPQSEEVGEQIFPDAATDPRVRAWMITLALIGIIYGALVAMAQKDVKKLVAYSSVSHLGFVMLGLFAFNPNGINGAVMTFLKLMSRHAQIPTTRATSATSATSA